jgi:HJR/Mrr/RecB family endonuclease
MLKKILDSIIGKRLNTKATDAPKNPFENILKIDEDTAFKTVKTSGDPHKDKSNYAKYIQIIDEYEIEVSKVRDFLNENFNPNWGYKGSYAVNSVLDIYRIPNSRDTNVFILPLDFAVLNHNKLIMPALDLKLPNLPKKLFFNPYLEQSEKRKLSRANDFQSYCSEFIKTIIHQKELYKSKLGDDLDNARKSSDLKTPINAISLIKCAHLAYPLPQLLRRDIEVFLDEAEKILLIEYDFPNYDGEDISIYNEKSFSEKLASPTQKKKIVKQCLQSIAIRIGFIASIHNITNLYESVAININHKWFDKATGKEKQGVILSLYASVKEFADLNLSKIDPDVCFKSLKGILTPSIENTSPIRPIFVMNKDDKRIVDTKNVAADLKEDENLAAMDWEDFESLVAQLFEWEFAKNGIEVKVTQASRDKGVDALLFDPDPLKGGKYVLQAKRYTRTVDVSAVRDLYGTMMNEGANKGIIITTSSYGKDAYDFAKNKPLSLVDGNHLLQLLAKHGKKYRINLEEARRLYKESL